MRRFLMNLIKTNARNRLETDHLDQLMRIKLYIGDGSPINLDNVHNFWKTEKGRRENV